MLVKNRFTGNDIGEFNISSGADLSGANLRDADLSGANLIRADLSGADLIRAKEIPEYATYTTMILPDGDLIGWKKCSDNVIVKLRIPSDARRSNATSRKCRAEFADVIEVIGAEYAVSKYDNKTEYRVGQRVTCNTWDEDRWTECGGGIHFFITRYEAEQY